MRVVFCDAEAHDNGWMHPFDIAGRVRVRGRGGTVLQPGVDLPQDAPDFPKDGPILVITDAWIDRVRIRREHAYLPPGRYRGGRCGGHAAIRSWSRRRRGPAGAR